MGLILGSGGKGGRRGRRALNAEINVTPFVDVMLVLLIVFMITAPLLVRGEDVALPKTRSGPIKTEPNDAPLAITVQADGTIFVQNTEVSIDELGAKLAAIIGEGYEQQMYLRADASVPYGRIMDVTAEVRAAGYTRLAFVTEQKK
ncbi:ExbD/TolR family protein [Hyphomonas johnsonii]|jgi:biopolymer transport protein TolR|uniref:ExbD/TolR family transport energizing protein n=1 Tax=Hyphomonas johnsonii MHS-2 TaxID=1280950 RepID=A0A059FNT3_9PROT|nr:biopolymer transporter ExbD [Hyphomonas johnsonii]KCZ92304.1 ExbD/TolR family transport energizing protein [Hyphomonas johnsonii MHS-2]